jgi:hypothetical protein
MPESTNPNRAIPTTGHAPHRGHGGRLRQFHRRRCTTSTQSTVSQKVRRLEEMVGHQLLDRSNREVHPTDAGETLLGFARHLLAVSSQLVKPCQAG